MTTFEQRAGAFLVDSLVTRLVFVTAFSASVLVGRLGSMLMFDMVGVIHLQRGFWR